MSIKIDTKHLDAFADKLKRASQETQEKVTTKALKNIAAEVLRRAVKQTPRDTSNLARRWTDHITPVDQKAKVVSQKSWIADEPVTQSGRTYKLTVSNSALYVPYVEYGHRTRDHKDWIPGKFMLTRAVEDVNKMKDQMILEVVNKYFGELLK